MNMKKKERNERNGIFSLISVCWFVNPANRPILEVGHSCLNWISTNNVTWIFMHLFIHQIGFYSDHCVDLGKVFFFLDWIGWDWIGDGSVCLKWRGGTDGVFELASSDQVKTFCCRNKNAKVSIISTGGRNFDCWSSRQPFLVGADAAGTGRLSAVHPLLC